MGMSLNNCILCIFVHNHPSGEPEPSEDDIKLTKRLADAGNILSHEALTSN
jgi:DNA repair protein RadC